MIIFLLHLFTHALSFWPSLRPVQTPATLLANKTQHCWAQHVASVCTPCCVLLRVVATCWKLLDEVSNWSNFRANISIVSWSTKRGPTMLRSFAQHIQQCCAGAHALHATYPLFSHLKTQHVVTCCERLHTSCNKRQQCWPNNVACCCERLHRPLGIFCSFCQICCSHHFCQFQHFSVLALVHSHSGPILTLQFWSYLLFSSFLLPHDKTLQPLNSTMC